MNRFFEMFIKKNKWNGLKTPETKITCLFPNSWQFSIIFFDITEAAVLEYSMHYFLFSFSLISKYSL